MPKRQLQHPGVHFPPPTLFVIAGLSGWQLESAMPLPLSQLLAMPVPVVPGWAALIAGIAVLLWGLATFLRARTAIYPNQPARQLVAHGPYRFSRNPMYVALTAILIGVALLADNLWMLLLTPVVLFVLTTFVIKREEAYLTSTFGDRYSSYVNRVRRWL